MTREKARQNLALGPIENAEVTGRVPKAAFVAVGTYRVDSERSLTPTSLPREASTGTALQGGEAVASEGLSE